MNLSVIAILSCAFLLAGILVMIESGRRIGVRRYQEEGEIASKGFSAVEGAVFALLGLVLAFSFSGALSRFDDRRELVVREVNDIGTAWLRINLLPPDKQPAMRDHFRRYLDARIEAYGSVGADMAATRSALARSAAVQKDIWALAVPASPETATSVAPLLLLPALNTMFDTATSQQEAARLHPPGIIFGMLGALILACALFAGYDMGSRPNLNLLHSIAFAVVLSVTVYVIIDLEYPRLGFIQMSDSDAALVALRAGMQ
jgi:hypothetical protein